MTEPTNNEITPIKVRAAKLTAEGAEVLNVFTQDGAGVRPNGTLGAGIVRSDGKVATLNGRHAAVKQALDAGLIVDIAEERKAERAKARAETKKAGEE